VHACTFRTFGRHLPMLVIGRRSVNQTYCDPWLRSCLLAACSKCSKCNDPAFSTTSPHCSVGPDFGVQRSNLAAYALLCRRRWPFTRTLRFRSTAVPQAVLLQCRHFICSPSVPPGPSSIRWVRFSAYVQSVAYGHQQPVTPARAGRTTWTSQASVLSGITSFC
jgi:hypothetical protein